MNRLTEDSLAVRAASRRRPIALPSGAESVLVGDLSGTTDWLPALEGVDTVVHLAGRVHVMRETAADPLTEYRRANVEGTINIARQLASVGGRRLVFLSSIKVNGEAGTFRESDIPNPHDLYGITKQEAEVCLRRVAAETGLEVVIIRAPLVYGPAVRGNFAALMRVVATGVPLPLGAVHNRRSLVALDNLVDFILACMNHPAAANETFLVSDGEDLSTTDLIRRLARAMGRPARLIPVSPAILSAAAIVLRKKDFAGRLLGSLQADISKARELLAWRPSIGVDEGLRVAVARFNAKGRFH
jgi:nucleoside-diphosphate-sugar epimerase